jgi:hypothetical protein
VHVELIFSRIDGKVAFMRRLPVTRVVPIAGIVAIRVDGWLISPTPAAAWGKPQDLLYQVPGRRRS